MLPRGCSQSMTEPGVGAAQRGTPLSGSLCWGVPVGMVETFSSCFEALPSQSSFLPSLPLQESGLHLGLKAFPAYFCCFPSILPGRFPSESLECPIPSQKAGPNSDYTQEQRWGRARGRPSRLVLTVQTTVKQKRSGGRVHVQFPWSRGYREGRLLVSGRGVFSVV